MSKKRVYPSVAARAAAAALLSPARELSAPESVNQGCIAAQLSEINKKLDGLQKVQATPSLPPRQKYTPAEFAAIVGRKPYTVREWCRYGRLLGEKVKGVGRGSEEEWRITHGELARYQNEGLRAVDRGKY